MINPLGGHHQGIYYFTDEGKVGSIVIQDSIPTILDKCKS